MSHYLTLLKQVAEDLNNLNLDWALIGALACSVYGEDQRTTKDIEDVISVADDEQLEIVLSQLVGLGYYDKQLLLHMQPTRRLGYRVIVPSSTDIRIPLDLLSNYCGIEDEIVSSAKLIDILPNLSFPVASIGHLLAMKVLSHNDQDRSRDKEDISSLLAVAKEGELTVTKQALELMMARGFGEGRNLVQEWEVLVNKE